MAQTKPDHADTRDGRGAASPLPSRAPRPRRQDQRRRPEDLTWRQRLSNWDARWAPYLYISPFFIVFGVVGLFPLAFTAWVSVHEWSLLGGKGEFVGLQNYREVWENPYFLKQTVNTLSIFVLSSGPQIVIAVVLAALLDNQLRGRTWWRMGILLPFVVSPVAFSV